MWVVHCSWTRLTIMTVGMEEEETMVVAAMMAEETTVEGAIRL